MAARKTSSPGSPNKRKSSTEPVAAVGELKGFWSRAFDENGYLGFPVEVSDRHNNILSFYFLDPGTGARLADEKVFTVNLDDGTEAWSSLPSTAQLVDPESSQRIGYLFLTKPWLKRHGRDVSTLPKGPGNKWPPSVSL